MAGNLTKEQQDQKDYQDYLDYQRYLQASAQAANPQVIPDAADKEANGKMPKDVSLVPRGAAQQDIHDLQAMDPSMKAGFAKAAVAMGAGPLAASESAGLGMLGRASVNAGAMGLQKYLGNIIDNKSDRTEGVPGSAVLGGTISLGADSLSSGLSKSADWLQQKAMGLKKYLQGVGTEAIDQGIRGSRDAMLSQTENALENIGDHAAESIGKLGRIDSAEAAGPLAKYASGMKVGDIVPGHSTSEYSGALNRANELIDRGEVPALDAWRLAQEAGKSGFKNQKALQSEAAMLAQLEQQGYSNAIKQAYAQANPGATNEVAEDFAKMSKLYKARAALDVDPTIRSGLPLNVLAAAGLGAAAGGMTDHTLTGALKGAALGLAVRNPTVQSYGAKGLSALGQGAGMVADPAILQGLFGLTQATPKNPQSE